jgi:hypothetical protein
MIGPGRNLRPEGPHLAPATAELEPVAEAASLVLALEATGLAHLEAVAQAMGAVAGADPWLEAEWLRCVQDAPTHGGPFAAMTHLAGSDPQRANALLAVWLDQQTLDDWPLGARVVPLNFHPDTIVVLNVEARPAAAEAARLRAELGTERQARGFHWQPSLEAIHQLLDRDSLWTDATTALEVKAAIRDRNLPLVVRVTRPDDVPDDLFLAALAPLAYCQDCGSVLAPLPLSNPPSDPDPDEHQPIGECPCCGEEVEAFEIMDLPRLRSGPVPR